MPFRSETGGFTGDSNMGDFIDQIVETFLTDAKASGGLGWTSHSHTGSPARSKGSSPNFEFYFSRGGSPAQLPIWCMQTTSRTLYIYSGNDIDTTQESFDQPGNPMNEPPADPPSDLTTGSIGQLRCLGITSAAGPYDGYWVFGGPTGEYCHVVLKVGARQYRHFHVGKLTPLVADLSADTFYVTNHRWGWLGPDNLTTGDTVTNIANIEHQPYNIHITPFSNHNTENVDSGWDGRSKGMWVYSPNYGSEGYDWWFMTGDPASRGPANGGSGASIYGRWQQFSQPGSQGDVIAFTKSIGDVNASANAVLFGTGFVSGMDNSFGAVPFSCEPTFTTDGVALIPILVGLGSDFESLLRWGPVGQVPDVFRVNMKSLDAEQEISIGSDTYVVFPLINKDANNTLSNEGYSGYEGLAYKKITANAT